jgi:hypothetical protein
MSWEVAMPRSTRLIAAVASAVLAAGCGLSTSPSAGPRAGSVEALASRALTNDADLAGPQGLKGAGLIREAVGGLGNHVDFNTLIISPMTGRSVLPKGEGPVVGGALRYPDFAGKLIAAANVTIHLEAKGTFGTKDVATAVTDAEGRWSAELPAAMAGKPVSVSYELGNQYWTINKYRWVGPAIESLQAVNDTGVRALDPTTENGQAALIHQIWNRALGEFQKDGIAIDWWKSRINTNWPANGNYYSFGTVNLTDATQWDVNGHEIGHSLFFAGFNSAAGGGEHKIDECYGADLAWSEGFASFFSGVISVARDDADAKFEFMVPRRKPIRLENIPTDVCEGYTNEWRVSAALWDLYDTHEDGSDRVAVDFKTIWGALVKTHNSGRMNDVRDAFQRISAAVPADQRQSLAAAFAQAGVPVTVRTATK